MNLASATHHNYLGLWKDFAFSVLPQIEYLLFEGNLRGILGCTNKYGDVGNEVYHLVVEVALRCGTGYTVVLDVCVMWIREIIKGAAIFLSGYWARARRLAQTQPGLRGLKLWMPSVFLSTSSGTPTFAKMYMTS